MKTRIMHVRMLLLIGLFLLATKLFSQDQNFYIFLCFGQSNMEGQGTIEQQDQTVDSRFRVMEAIDCSNLGRTKGNWYTATPPLCRCYTGLSPADYFGRTLVANLASNIRVGVINVSVAGCKIELFDKVNYQSYVSTAPSWMLDIINAYGGNPYGRLVEIAKLAQKDGVIKGILLHQGESNTGDNAWPSKVKGVYDNLIKDLGLNAASVPLLAGEVVNADQGGVCASMNSIIATLPQTISTSYVISSSGCTDASDNLHFNSAGYRELGRRYAVKMLSLLGQTNIPVTGVTVSPATITVNIGGTTQLTAIVAPSNATNKTVTWSSSSSAIATVGSTGLVTGVAAGSATITATTVDGAFKATCAVTVSNTTIPVTGIIVSPTTAAINVGGTTQLTATVAPSNATNKTVTWSSGNPAIATVNSTGLVTGVVAGSATITATTTDGGFKATCAVTVSSAPSCNFGTPLAVALPTLSGSYTKIYILGTGGPSLSNVTNFTINWSLTNNGLWQLSFNTNNGIPTWWLDLRTKATWKFNQAQPEITLTGTGISGLDGTYWVAIDGSNFVMVSKTGGFTIYFSNSGTAPICNKSAKDMPSKATPRETFALFYPNPAHTNLKVELSTAPESKVIMQIYNVTGIQVQQVITNEKITTVDLSGLKNGVYYLIIKLNNKSIVEKFVKQ